MNTTSGKAAKRTSWAVTIFYLLIAFEFFYMASPFAIYFYSVYGPDLESLGRFPILSWATQFFLPHIVEDTKSPLINNMGMIGGIFFGFGLLVFFSCAAQVYYKKLFKKGVVTGGLYAFIRHPQYTGFALSSFGMLLIWPRYLVLLTFITLLFVYYFLAKTEERECENKFGQSYSDYRNRTFMFLPFRFSFFFRLFKIPLNSFQRHTGRVVFYLLSLTLSVLIAAGIRSLSVDALYATFNERAVCLSILKNDTIQINNIMRLACQDHRVDSIMKAAAQQKDFRSLNYILPAAMYQVSEIPMNIPKDENCNFFDRSFDRSRVKVIFTRANLNTGRALSREAILLHTRSTTPLIEVWIDLSSGKVIKTIIPSNILRYKNIPMPVF
ncbi:MAG: isoprenylcysteine carboxylmethyltransferase family protein [Bacteroidetes bacterium]|nr:isoprenylcysteine carboxylmethyltransferase family protein [Bacteroidota bacterium]